MDSVFSLHEIKPTKSSVTDFSVELTEVSKLAPRSAMQINFGSRRLKQQKSETLHLAEILDEDDVRPMLIMLNQLFDAQKSGDLQLSDLERAVEQFLLAMNSIEKISCFNHLYSSLGLATDADGQHTQGQEFDSKVSNLTGVSETILERWRKFNNRLKHPDKNSGDRRTYEEGKKNLESDLPIMRRSVAKLIRVRMEEHFGSNRRVYKDSLLKFSTRQLIRKFGPMMSKSELDDYEEKSGSPSFDIVFYHPLDTKTLWGNSKQYFENTILHSRISNNIYDLLADGYEVWIRDVSENSNAGITPEHICYAMSLEAKNMSEDGIALKFQIISGWLVISQDPYSDEHGPIAQKFYDHFGIFVDLSGAPDIGDTPEEEQLFEKYVEDKEKAIHDKWFKSKV